MFYEFSQLLICARLGFLYPTIYKMQWMSVFPAGIAPFSKTVHYLKLLVWIFKFKKPKIVCRSCRECVCLKVFLYFTVLISTEIFFLLLGDSSLSSHRHRYFTQLQWAVWSRTWMFFHLIRNQCRVWWLLITAGRLHGSTCWERSVTALLQSNDCSDLHQSWKSHFNTSPLVTPII